MMIKSTMPIIPPTMGVEEEYLLVDLETRDLTHRPEGFFADCEAALGERVSREFYRSQIEIGTRVHTRIGDLRDELIYLRETLAEVARRYDIGIVAASMHPFARQLDQDITPKERYQIIQHDLGIVGRRLAVCGMHVHVGIDDENERIDLMNQVRYFLPHLLTLSTSSPFFEGEDTGMKGYRLTLYQECPRSGLPERFSSWDDYQKTVDVLVRTGVIQDPTKIWWDIRPSVRFPTLEMRITDVCTRVDDTVAIAALYTCLLRKLSELRRSNQSWRHYADLLVNENRWRAMRYGVTGSLLDLGRGELVDFPQLLDELLELVRGQAEDIGCSAELEHLRRIAREGTSADRQLAVFKAAHTPGSNERAALRAVVDHLLAETLGRSEADPGVFAHLAAQMADGPHQG
jgi:carboxylate-amine ligase